MIFISLANFRPFTTRGTTNGGFQAFDVNDGAIAVAGTFDAASVPEPGSWSLMILGLVGLGAALRRRRAITA